MYLEQSESGCPTCKVQGRYLHSKYNPRREAEKFVVSLECTFNPFCIVLLGPCLSYCLPPLRKRFPKIPLYAVQYDKRFMPDVQNASHAAFSDALQSICGRENWDGVFLCAPDKNEYQSPLHNSFVQSSALSETLFSYLGEEQVFGALFAAWQPAEQVFTEKSRIAWEAVKLLLQKSRDVLATRSFFSRRWLKNAVRFCIYAQHPCGITAGDKPVLALASGPSLQTSLPLVRKYRSSFFLIVLSSALNVLIHNDIFPDLCITTDGGFYARYHIRCLKKLYDKGIHIPTAASAESRLDSFLLENLPLVPLRYGDGIESVLLDLCGIQAIHALRNGSVSGTAAHLALSLSSSHVFFCGLDLKSSKGYPHAQPNVLEQNDSLSDNRLKPLASRLHASSCASLDVYRRWFSAQNTDFSKRIFRLNVSADTDELGQIRNVSWDDIKAETVKWEKEKAPQIHPIGEKNTETNKKRLVSFLTEQRNKIIKNGAIGENLPTEQKLWYETCAPAEYLSSLKYPESNEFKEKCTASVLHTFDELFRLCR